jgi:sensor domain DACNV-containing protein
LYAISEEEEMTGPAYPAAHSVAPKVHAHFVRHTAEARARGEQRLATVPDAETIEAMIDAAFWASLRREEIYVPKISLAFLSPQQSAHPLTFGRPLPLEPGALVRLAPAVERAGIHLGVWRDGSDLAVWGTTRAIPPLCCVIEVAAPGLLVIKHHRGEEAGKYVNVAVLEGDQIKVVDEQASSLPDCPSLLTSLLGFDSPAAWVDSVNLMVQLAVSMRTHGRGGLLLVVPAGSDAWLESMVRPIPYAVVPAFAELAQLRRETPDDRRHRLWQDTVARAVEAIAGLTAVDGATVLTTDYELLAFGAKIARRKGSPQVEQVTMTEPIEGGVAALVHPTQLGGTRHLSAAQFVHDQRDAIALVASQDGRFTVFAWSACEAMVHAHRVETLLL